MRGVALTSLWIAAKRAVESERPDALFHDPLARVLAGDEGFAVLELETGRAADRRASVPVRTVFFDERIARHPQVVLLAAGMDGRAFRLAWPAGTRVFEVDQPEVLGWKEQRLDGAEPKCTRVAVPIDLREDWPAALAAGGFDRRAPTTWLLEGLLPYLDAPAVHALLARVDHLAAPGSVLLMDVLGAHILTSPRLRPMLEFVASLGAPWIFGTEDPVEANPANSSAADYDSYRPRCAGLGIRRNAGISRGRAGACGFQRAVHDVLPRAVRFQ